MKTTKLNYDRIQLLKVLKQKRKDFDIVVELGTNRGAFAEKLFTILKPKTFIAVDPFLPYDGLPPSMRKVNLNKLATAVQQKISKFSKTSKLLKKLSTEAADDFEDKSVDLVYIDADHVYESVKADIEAWVPKLKDNGILAGHDYVPRSSIEIFGVIQAVNEFCEKFNYDLHITNDKWTTWIISINRENLFE